MASVNWDMFGAVAEGVGALGVILSLLYLAAQIREGARATRRANAHELNEGTRGWWEHLAKDEDIAHLWQRGLTRYESLTPVEALRFSAITLQIATLWEELYYASKDADLPEWAGAAFRLGMREIVPLPGFHRWYEERGHWLSPDFRQAVEKAMQDKATYRPASFLAAFLESGRD